ncbi:MAG: pseudouridine-5'-phosphate glycosidase [marine benthic group bacterium]|nr:pseudouridine-5'-phosphate glycosidase [Candidatus Benthicola marisminoris]
MDRYLDVRVEVAAALATGRPVVALETTVFAHGLPHPSNLEAARAMEKAVREEGAVPATIGLLRGRAVVGLTPDEIEELAVGLHVAKVSVRDIAPLIASRMPGATTVAGTAALARAASISVVATGGIGGVHRGGEASLDVSADLQELAEAAIAVVCAGAKSVLDLERTLETLETLGVPVIGFGTDEFPAFYSADSGLPLEHRADTPREVATVLEVQRALKRRQGVLVVQPPPPEAAIPLAEVEKWVATALEEAARSGTSGKRLTPYLLDSVKRSSGGRSLATNLALLESNARLAARVARELL